jgi:hypothetical protein
MEQRWWYSAWLFGAVNYIASFFLKTVVEGAQTTLYCCLEDAIETHSGKYYSDCKEVEPHARALDEDAQKKLCEVSEKMVGLKK